jgi:hypothetical protein
MAFLDSPIIDPSSRNSEKSELKLRHFLNQESGFICRSEVPDKGCDFDVELILENKNSSSWKFPIQLKSVEKLTLVNKGEFISYSFETSRLGYLMRRIPTMGIVVLYSLEQDKCFYEYADKLFGRLMEERESDDWKKNDKVNIRVPYANILSEDTAIDIHKTMHNRFEQALTMQNSYGPKYGLPTVNLNQDFKYDFNNLDHIIKFLEEHGQSLIRNFDIDMIFQMVTRVPHIQIYRNKNLLLVAAVAYSETGLNSESETFCNKLKKIPLESTEELMIHFIRLKNQLALGYINKNDFLLKLKELSRLELDGQNRVTVNINIIRYELLELKVFNQIPVTFLSSIFQIFNDIRNSDLTYRTKGLFMLWNCENLSHLASLIMTSSIGDFKIREKLGENIPLSDRQSATEGFIKIENKIYDIIAEVANNAKSNNDKLLAANTFSLDVRHFLLNQVNMISFDIPIDSGDYQKVVDRISNAERAYANFLNLNLYNEAYDSMCNLIELVELAEKVYHIKYPKNKTDLYQWKGELENDFDVTPRQIAITDLLTYKSKKIDEDQDLFFCRDMDDVQIEFLAKTVLHSLSLPVERLGNIIEELMAYRMFHQRCVNKNIEVVQVKTLQDYSEPIFFCLKSKLTGIQTPPRKSMDSLLKGWGY